MVEEQGQGFGAAELGGSLQLKKLLGAALEHRLRLVLCASFGLILGTGVAALIPDLYECKTTMLLRERALIDDSTLLRSLEEKPLVQKEATLAQELRSYNWIEEVLQKAEWVEYAQVRRDRTKLTALVDKVRDAKKFEVQVDTDTAGELLVKLKFRWYDPKLAHDFLLHARKNWITKREEDARNFYTVKLGKAEELVKRRRDKYDTKTTQLESYQEQNNLVYSTDRSLDQQAAEWFSTEILKTQANIKETETQILKLEELLRSTPQKLEKRQHEKNPEYEDAKAALGAAKDGLTQLLQKFTDSHPDVKKGKERVAELEKAFAALKGQEFAVNTVQEEINPTWAELNKALGQLVPERDGRKERLADYERQMKEIERRLQTLPAVMNKLADLEREVEVAWEELKAAEVEITPLRDKVSLLEQSSAATFTDTEEAMEATGAFEILEEPVVPEHPTGLPKPVISLIGLLVGAAFSLALSLLAVVTRSTFDSVEEVSRTLKLPVLGAVGRIATPAELRAEKLRGIVQAAGGILIVVTLGVLVYVVIARPELLPPAFQSAIEDLRQTFQ